MVCRFVDLFGGESSEGPVDDDSMFKFAGDDPIIYPSIQMSMQDAPAAGGERLMPRSNKVSAFRIAMA